MTAAMSFGPQAAAAECDVVVVGGGPAGLSATLALASAGLTVTLVDESTELGGQYYKRRLGQVREAHGDFRPAGTALVNSVRRSGATIYTGRLVWGVDDDHQTILTTGTENSDYLPIRADSIVVTTGAYERSIPFPGWQLPGVVTPGFALHMATCDVLPVGRRAIVAGTGPFLLSTACAMLDVGVQVVGIAEASHPYRLSRRGIGGAAHPARLWELAGYLRRLAAKQVPVWQGAYVENAVGTDRLQAVELSRVSGARQRRRTVEVDTLAVGYGFRPSTELLRLLRVECRVDESTGDVLPMVDEWGRTTVSGVYAAGETCGIAGVHAAMARGRLAAAAVLVDRGTARATDYLRGLRRVRRQQRFADLQAALFPAPWGIAAAVPDVTQVCRCEGVRAGEIRAAADTGWNDRNGAKGLTRAGMGPCQGRECGFAVSAIMGAHHGWSIGDPFPSRMPIKPISIGGALVRDLPGVEGKA